MFDPNNPSLQPKQQDPLLSNAPFMEALNHINQDSANSFLKSYADSLTYQPDYKGLIGGMTEQNTFALPTQEEQTVSFMDKFKARASLDNITGRLLFEANKMDARNGWLPDSVDSGGSMDVASYFKMAAPGLEKTSEGQNILALHSEGHYDEYNGKDPQLFMAQLANDFMQADFEKKAAMSTGSWVGDWTANLVGTMADPIGLISMGKIAQGAKWGYYAIKGKRVVDAVRATEIAAAAGKATMLSRATSYVGKTIVESAKDAAVFVPLQEGTLIGLAKAGGEKDHTVAQSLASLPENYAYALVFGSLLKGFGDAAKFGEMKYKTGGDPFLEAAYKLYGKNKSAFDELTKELPPEFADLYLMKRELDKANAPLSKQVQDELDRMFNEGVQPQQVAQAPAAAPVDAVATEAKAPKDLPKTEPNPYLNNQSVDRGAAAELAGKAGTELPRTGKLKDIPMAADLTPVEAKPQNTPVGEGKGAFSPEETAMLKDVMAKQAQSTTSPLEANDQAIAQLEKIANRDTQMFSYGRLDEMGLRKVEIKQPILQAFFEKVVPPEGYKLDQLLAELKKADLQTKLAAIDEAGLKDALDVWDKMTGSKETAANAVLDLASSLAEKKRTNLVSASATDSGDRFTGAGAALSMKIRDLGDYNLDRSNDVWLKVAEAQHSLLKKEGEVNPNTGGMKLSKVANLTKQAIKYEIGANRLDAALFSIYSPMTIPMVGQTENTIAKMVSVYDMMQNTSIQRAKAEQVALVSPFKSFVRPIPKPEAARNWFFGGEWVGWETAKKYEAFNHMTEELRINRNASVLKSSRLKRQAGQVDNNALITLVENGIVDKYKEELWPGIDYASYAKVKQDMLAYWEKTGFVGQAGTGKLSESIPFAKNTVMSKATSVCIDNGADMTMGKLDTILSMLFRAEERPLTDSPTSGKYIGLDRFVKDELVDAQTGKVFRSKQGIISADEIKIAETNPIAERNLVQKVVWDYNNNWHGMAGLTEAQMVLAQFPESVTASSTDFLKAQESFLVKLHTAENLYKRTLEFYNLELKKMNANSGESALFSNLVRFYDNLQGKLAQGENKFSPETFRNITQFNDDTLAALFEYNKQHARQTLGSLEAERAVEQSSRLEAYLREHLNMSPKQSSDPRVDAVFNFVGALQLKLSGISQIPDAFRTLGHATTLQMGTLPALWNFVPFIRADLVKSGMSPANLGTLLETQTIGVEDVLRITQMKMRDDVASAGATFRGTTKSEKFRGFTGNLMGLVNKLSMNGPITRTQIDGSFTNELLSAIRPGTGDVSNSALIAKKIEAGSSVVEAVKAVAKEQGLKPAAASELYTRYGAMSSFFSGEEIVRLSNLINHVDEHLAIPQMTDELAKTYALNPEDFKLRAIKVQLKRNMFLEAMYGPKEVESLGFGPTYSEGIETALRDKANVNAVKGAIGEVSNAQLLRQLGNYLDFTVKRYGMNVPGPTADFIGGRNGIPNRLMQQFLRTATEQANNALLRGANGSIVNRTLVFGLVASGALLATYLRAYISGHHDQLEENWSTTQGKLQFVSKSLDYSGYTPWAVSKGISWGGDIFFGDPYAVKNAGRSELTPPAISTITGLVTNPLSALNKKFITHEDISEKERTSLIKYITGGLLDTTAIRGPLEYGRNHGLFDGTKAEDILNAIYGEK